MIDPLHLLYFGDKAVASNALQNLPKNVHPSIQDAFIAFHWNMLRWMSLHSLPRVAAECGISYERAIRVEMWKQYGHPFRDDGDVFFSSELVDDAMRRRFDPLGTEGAVSIPIEWSKVFQSQPGMPKFWH